jgi:hypothetical protein
LAAGREMKVRELRPGEPDTWLRLCDLLRPHTAREELIRGQEESSRTAAATVDAVIAHFRDPQET